MPNMSFLQVDMEHMVTATVLALDTVSNYFIYYSGFFYLIVDLTNVSTC